MPTRHQVSVALIILCLFGLGAGTASGLALELDSAAVEPEPEPEQMPSALPTAGEATAAAASVAAAPRAGVAPQFKQADFDLRETATEIIVYLLVLCVIAAGLIYVLRTRLVGRGAIPDRLGKHIQVLDRKVLSTRTTLHLLAVDDRHILLTESAQGHAMLELAPSPAEPGRSAP